MSRGIISAALCVLVAVGCKKRIKETEDNIYSRHLQKHVKLTIFSTPVPDDKGTFNLLLLNNADDVKRLKVRDALDSLNKEKVIQPVVVVAIHSAHLPNVYGIAGSPDITHAGASAEKYAAFVNDELYFFIKKKTGIRKFNSVVIAGTGLSGLSAFDIAWEYANRINKAGIFNGTFDLVNKLPSDAGFDSLKNNVVLSKIKSSRKKPHLQYWFFTNSSNANDTKKLVALLYEKKVVTPDDVIVTESNDKGNISGSGAFNQFLIWAIGN